MNECVEERWLIWKNLQARGHSGSWYIRHCLWTGVGSIDVVFLIKLSAFSNQENSHAVGFLVTLKVVSPGGAGIATVPSQWRLKGCFLLLMMRAHLCLPHTPHEASLTHFVICFTPELHARPLSCHDGSISFLSGACSMFLCLPFNTVFIYICVCMLKNRYVTYMLKSLLNLLQYCFCFIFWFPPHWKAKSSPLDDPRNPLTLS